MTIFSHPIVSQVTFKRSFALAALLGATMLTAPLTARADTVAIAAFQLAQAAAPAAAPQTQAGAAATGKNKNRMRFKKEKTQKFQEWVKY
jgi:hypothetical protein